MRRNCRFQYMTDVEKSEISSHLSYVFHMSVLSHFPLFCCKIICWRFLFCRDLHAFAWRKIEPKNCACGEKITNIRFGKTQLNTRSPSFLFTKSKKTKIANQLSSCFTAFGILALIATTLRLVESCRNLYSKQSALPHFMALTDLPQDCSECATSCLL